MIVATGHVGIAPESIKKARPHVRAVLAGTRPEPGCILYTFAEDVLEPGTTRIVERWRDWPSLEAHDRAGHVVAWRAALKGIGVIDREVIAPEAGAERRL